jgi:hypothetical protein
MSTPNPILTGLQRDFVASHPRRRPSSPQGEPMPTVASAQAAIEHAAMRLAEIRSSKLAVALADEGLGGLLSDLEVGHVVALVRSLEEPRRRRPVQLPEAVGNGNGTHETGSQQQVTE